MKNNILNTMRVIPFLFFIGIFCILPLSALAEKGDGTQHQQGLQTSPMPQNEIQNQNRNAGDTPIKAKLGNQWRMPHSVCNCEQFIQDDERLPALLVIMDNGGTCDEGDFEILLEDITRQWFDAHWDDPGYYEEYVFIEDPGLGSCGQENADEYDAQNRITTELQQLNDDGYFIDVVILTHGSQNTGISIVGNNLGSGEIPNMAGDRDQLAIRMVYQMNCFGQFLNDAWMDLGAQTVSGSRYVNFLPILFASVFNNLYLGEYACPISNIAGLANMILPIPPMTAIANTAVQACASSLVPCGWLNGQTYHESVNDCMYDKSLAQEMADRIGNIVYPTKNKLIDMMGQEGFDEACDALGYDCDNNLTPSKRAAIVYWSSEPVYAGNTSLSIYSDFEGCKNVGICDECPAIYDPNADRSDSDSLPDICDNCPNTANDDQADSDSDGTGDLCDNCPDDYNPLQIDSDGDEVGDACDYPDLVLEVNYSSSTSMEVGNETQMTWTISGVLKNAGTDPIDIGTTLYVIWEQETLMNGQASDQSSDQEGGNGDVQRIIAMRNSKQQGPQVMIVGPDALDEDDESDPLAVASETVFEFSTRRIEKVELNFGLNPGNSVTLADQQFHVTMVTGDCAEVTHTVNVDATNVIKELDGQEDNKVELSGYSFWGCGGEMDEDIIDRIIDGIIGPEVIDDWADPDDLITEVMLDKILETIGSDGGIIEIPHEHISIEFASGAVDVRVQVQISQDSADTVTDFTALSNVIDISVPKAMRFSKLVVLTFGYDENDLPEGVAEGQLTVFVSGGNMWKPIPSEVDVVANTVTTSVNQFSRFAIGSIKEFKTSRNMLKHRVSSATAVKEMTQQKEALIERKLGGFKKARPVAVSPLIIE